MNLNRLVVLRKEAGKRQQDMASILGVDRTTYNKYENGITEPSNEGLIKLADYFNVSTDYLLGNTDTPDPPGKEKAPTDLTPVEAAIAYFEAEKGRPPTEEELNMFRAFTKPVLDSLPDKRD